MKFLCPKCMRRIRLKKDGLLRHHPRRDNDGFCAGSGTGPAVGVADLRHYHVFDEALHHCPDPEDSMGHLVEFVDGSDSLARMVELATAHTCEDNDA